MGRASLTQNATCQGMGASGCCTRVLLAASHPHNQISSGVFGGNPAQTEIHNGIKSDWPHCQIIHVSSIDLKTYGRETFSRPSLKTKAKLCVFFLLSNRQSLLLWLCPSVKLLKDSNALQVPPYEDQTSKPSNSSIIQHYNSSVCLILTINNVLFTTIYNQNDSPNPLRLLVEDQQILDKNSKNLRSTEL